VGWGSGRGSVGFIDDVRRGSTKSVGITEWRQVVVGWLCMGWVWGTSGFSFSFFFFFLFKIFEYKLCKGFQNVQCSRLLLLQQLLLILFL
jgi:hypothetical protein